jgi:hypothetical protein
MSDLSKFPPDETVKMRVIWHLLEHSARFILCSIAGIHWSVSFQDWHRISEGERFHLMEAIKRVDAISRGAQRQRQLEKTTARHTQHGFSTKEI